MISRFIKPLGIAAFAAAMVLPGIASAADTTTTVTGGDLTAGISGAATLELSGSGDPIYQHVGTQSVVGEFTIAVDDARGTDTGWTVSVQASDFLTDGDGAAIDASANFDQSAASVVTHVAGDPASGVTPTASPALLNIETGYVVLGAAEANGSGSYTATMPVSLTIPAQTLVGDYTSTVTVTTGAAPEA